VRVRTLSYYFPDPAGNILECIVRVDLPAKAGEDFGPENILHISEIGLVVDDVPSAVKQLKTRLGIEVYRDSAFEDFAQLGDINGVLVLAKRGRLWVYWLLRISVPKSAAQMTRSDPFPLHLSIM
jgi:hypothetical protein